MNELKFRSQVDGERVAFCDFLLGYDVSHPSNYRMRNWDGSRRVLASPLKWYLGEVARFSINLGPQFDIPNSKDDEPRQTLIDRVVEGNDIPQLMSLALERAAVTGACYLTIHPDSSIFYKIYLYDESEVCQYPNGWDDQGWMVQAREGDKYTRLGFTDTHLITYSSTANSSLPWIEKERKEHGYGCCPLIQYVGKFSDHSKTPCPIFDKVALDIASEICAQTLASSASHLYFGSPFLVSSDPEATSEELLARSQVLTGRQSQETQDTALLSASPMPTSQESLLDDLGQSFCNHLGVSWVPETPPGDTSSLTLRMLYSKSINHAQTVGGKLTHSFTELLELVLVASGVDGVLGGIDLTNPETYEVEHSTEFDLFPLTPQEKLTILSVVEQLIQLGVKAEVALAEYYTTQSTDEITELMAGY